MKYLKDIALEIKAIASEIPNVNTVHIGEITDLNRGDVEYSAIVISVGDVEFDVEYGHKKCYFDLFYVDLQDDTESNLVDIQSHAVEVLINLINELYERNENVEIDRIQPFSDRLQALCGGAMVSVGVTVDANQDCKVF